MNVYIADKDLPLVIILVIVGALVVIAGLVLLYIFVISRLRYKQQIKDLKKKFSYLDALLIGQDTQYIHRLEMISRSNLLYVDKHEEFSKRFKEIFENDDQYAKSMFDRLDELVKNEQYKALKKNITEAKKAVAIFEEKVNKLDNDLFALIKPEEDTRHAILKLKDNYRRLKQIFYSNSSDLDLVSSSFIKVFDKLDSYFTNFENLIECADYDSANNMIPKVQTIISALEKALIELPKLCILAISVVPEKINELKKNFLEVEKKGLPLYNLTFKNKTANWENALTSIKEKLVRLKSEGIEEELNGIIEEINTVQSQLDSELSDKDFFLENVHLVYEKSLELEKYYLKVCSALPAVREAYKIEKHQEEEIEKLNKVMVRLGDSKRSLDNFVHSNTKQPYSILKSKLDDLTESYDFAKQSMSNFKAYLETVKSSCEEARSLIFVYFYRLKQIESLLREMDVDVLINAYKERISDAYKLVNSIDVLLKTKPIDVASINEDVEELKNNANVLFDEVEEKHRQMQRAESIMVYANRDRKHQSDVEQQLDMLEKTFFSGEFDKVYNDANAVFSRNHAEDQDDDR